MTPKDKAQEILNRFYILLADTVVQSDKTHANTLNISELAMFIHEKTVRATEQAKKCATAHVDEFLKLELAASALMMYGMNYVSVHDYYSQVKQELEKI
jgi:hypothetical protein